MFSRLRILCLFPHPHPVKSLCNTTRPRFAYPTTALLVFPNTSAMTRRRMFLSGRRHTDIMSRMSPALYTAGRPYTIPHTGRWKPRPRRSSPGTRMMNIPWRRPPFPVLSTYLRRALPDKIRRGIRRDRAMCIRRPPDTGPRRTIWPRTEPKHRCILRLNIPPVHTGCMNSCIPVTGPMVMKTWTGQSGFCKSHPDSGLEPCPGTGRRLIVARRRTALRRILSAHHCISDEILPAIPSCYKNSCIDFLMSRWHMLRNLSVLHNTRRDRPRALFPCMCRSLVDCRRHIILHQILQFGPRWPYRELSPEIKMFRTSYFALHSLQNKPPGAIASGWRFETI